MTLTNEIFWSLERRTLTLVTCLLLGASAVQAATIEVTHLVDDANSANGTCTLREAIRAANANLPIDACPAGSTGATDLIIVKAGLHEVNLTTAPPEDLGQSGDLDIHGPIRIQGASSRHTIIQGSSLGAVDRLVQIHDDANDVTIEGVALRGGNATDGQRLGGVLSNLETGTNDVRLTDVEISGGRADRGGGIFNGGYLILRRCRILDNRTYEEGPLLGAQGGGIASLGVATGLIIEDSEVRANQALNDGGGVWVASGTLLAHRSKFLDNLAGTAGGAIYVAGSGFDIQDAELARNQALIGGGMYTSVSGELQRSLFLENSAATRGGGLHDAGGSFVRFSTFTQNTALEGSAVYAASNQTLLDSDTIAENSADALHNQQGLFLENTLIARNAGLGCGGQPPAFGAFNLEDADSCGLAPNPTGPNFPNANPRLGPLAENGGPTRTMALLAGSPAIDVVSSEIRTNCQNMLDQRAYPRGRPRTKNAANEDVYHCDIGAFEVVAPYVANSFLDAVDANPDDDRCLTAGGTCTLRAAVQQANAIPGMNEIVLGSGIYTLTRMGSGENVAGTGDLDLRPPASIRGAGVLLTTIEGQAFDRIFEVGDPPVEVSPAPWTSFIRDLTITGGSAGSENGGGIALRSPLRLDRVRLTANAGFRGAAISSVTTGSFFGSGPRQTVEIVDSTIDANPGGGALFLHDAVLQRSSLVDNPNINGSNGGGGEFLRVLFENSTVSGNHAIATGAFFASSALIESSAIYGNTADSGFDPGGVFLLSLSAIRNSIIANNRAGTVLSNCSANPTGVVSLGFNLTDGNGSDCSLGAPTDQIAANPLLGPLADNGGSTQTHLLLSGSPAIDRGDPASCPTRDQRGTPRPRDGDADGSVACDVGPVEVPEASGVAMVAVGVLGLIAGSRRRNRPVLLTYHERKGQGAASRAKGLTTILACMTIGLAGPSAATVDLVDGTVTPGNVLVPLGATYPLTVTGEFTNTSVRSLSHATIATGANHACVLAANGEVRCWGRGGSGQLGNGTSIDSPVPVTVADIADATAVAAGGDASCVIKDDASVQCWGLNDAGQLGNGTTNASSVPLTVSGVTAKAISAAVSHVCAVLTSGDVACWGANGSGQLGDGTSVGSSSPVLVDGIDTAIGIATGGNHSCALLSTGEVKCWGAGGSGQLGNGGLAGSPTPVDVAGIDDAVAIDAGFDHVCALIAGGTLRCWGRGLDGELGNGSFANAATPVNVAIGEQVVALGLGNAHGCAVLENGALRCWGRNANGQLGNATIGGIYPSPVLVADTHTAIAVDAGSEHSCALLANGNAICFGLNDAGQLGMGSAGGATPRSGIPLAVSGPVFGVDAGGNHTCATTPTGTVNCWGLGFYGQLGNDDFENYSVPTTVVGLDTTSGSAAENAVSLALGFDHTCAALQSGRAKCWGRNNFVQLGLNEIQTIPQLEIPRDVYGVTSAARVASGAYHSCVLLQSGGVQCWGNNDFGAVGSSVAGNYAFPNTVAGISTATRISAGLNHTCALLSSGIVQCWGRGDEGQLGNGSFASSSSPVTVAGITTATSIGVGNSHGCARLLGGTVRCWGRNVEGQLGNSSTVGSAVPVNVTSLTSATGVVSGGFHSCVTLSSGGVNCWGRGDLGQLGNGFRFNISAPVVVSGLAGAIAVDAGRSHSCAVLIGGRLRCWGYGEAGQLGNGAIGAGVVADTPVAVNGINMDAPALTWKSEDPSIATVDMSGHVHGVGVGTTTVSWGYDSRVGFAIVEVPEVGMVAQLVAGLLALIGWARWRSSGRSGSAQVAPVPTSASAPAR